MAVRWVICPLVFKEGLEVGALDDEGHVITKKVDGYEAKTRSLVVGRVQMVAHVKHGTGRWALCQVRADDFSAVEADPSCIFPFEEDESEFDAAFGEGRTETFRSRGWNQGNINRLQNLLESNGVDISALNLSLDTPKGQVLKAIRQSIARGTVT